LKTFRKDLRCGPYYDNAGCDPYGPWPCCMVYNDDHKGWCGHSAGHCECVNNPRNFRTCVKYMNAPFGYRDDNKCGRFDGFDVGCDPYGKNPCCNFEKGFCGNDADYCKCTTCMDYRNGMAGKNDLRSSEVTVECARRDPDRVTQVGEPKPGHYRATVAAKCACKECQPPCDEGKVCVKGECKGWQWLNGQTFTYYGRRYTYYIRPYGESNQGMGLYGYSLGKFTGWKDDKVGGIMLFDHGDTPLCPENTNRKSEIKFSCGGANRILQVSEPRKCDYRIKMQTPLKCIGFEKEQEQEQVKEQEQE